VVTARGRRLSWFSHRSHAETSTFVCMRTIAAGLHWTRMTTWPTWWTIGIAVGFGVALGVLGAGLAGGRRAIFGVVAIVAAAAAAVIGVALWGWLEAIGGIVGATLGVLAGGSVVAGAVRRGGTRGGLAFFIALAAIGLAALALVPIVGYVEAIVVPMLALRVRRRAPERYAGLRTLARD
jgi:hypothetical protein